MDEWLMFKFGDITLQQWAGIILAAGMLILVLVAFNRSNRPRRASLVGIESPAMIKDFDRISRWPQFKFLRRLILNELKLMNPAGTLADIGCGPGYLIMDIAGALHDLSIMGMDISSEALESARQNIFRSGFIERVNLRRGDIEQMPFADNSLDFIVSSLSLHHWSKPEKALGEIYRVLRKDGRFLIFDVRRDAPNLVYGLIYFAQAIIIPGSLARAGEPLGSFRAAYKYVEARSMLSATSFIDWHIKGGPAWLFLEGRK